MSRVREFPLPDLGEGLTEGEILKWFVAEGDLVTLNQPIVEVETAKAAVEIPSKWAGRVVRIFHPEGATVEVGSPIIAIDTQPDAGPIDVPLTPSAAPVSAAPVSTPTSAPPVSPSPSTPPAAPPTAASLAAVDVAPAEGFVEPGLIGGAAPGGRTAVLVGYGPRTTSALRRPRKAGSDRAGAPGGAAPNVVATAVGGSRPISLAGAEPGAGAAVRVPAGPVLAKPPVRKLARDLGVDLRGLPGSGPMGSVTRDDVQAALDTRTRREGAPSVLVTPSTAPMFGPNREQRIPIKGVRKLMAENMVASAFSAPHVTEFLTVDVTRAMRALDRLRELPEWRGVRVSPLLLAARAVLLAIARYPMVNSTWSGETGDIIVKEYVNLGIAAATPRGLVVPNIKDAGRLTLRELADALTALVATAKEGRTLPGDMTHGTFTITNVGVFGVDTGTPILPPGESAILAFGAVKEMPWAQGGKVRVRQVTTLGLSFDHRVIDGELGSKFLRDVGLFLGDPAVAQLAWS